MSRPKILIVACGLLLSFALPLHVSAQADLDSKVVADVKQSKVADVAIWFANGGEVDMTTREGNTLLMIASKIGDSPTFDYLLSQAPEVNAQNKVGATALMIAAKYGHIHLIEKLLDHGADPTIRTHRGLSAARFAQAYQHPEAFRLLLDAEMSTGRTAADINS